MLQDGLSDWHRLTQTKAARGGQDAQAQDAMASTRLRGTGDERSIIACRRAAAGRIVHLDKALRRRKDNGRARRDAPAKKKTVETECG
ncbi:hypothetical protein PCAR4_720032 [Paraburkholderia caribensis]|nr:hypothetical protein PCAR4_720032 [Paraburkholderia caribensis]